MSIVVNVWPKIPYLQPWILTYPTQPLHKEMSHAFFSVENVARKEYFGLWVNIL
jgi:hypothetical protein